MPGSGNRLRLPRRRALRQKYTRLPMAALLPQISLSEPSFQTLSPENGQFQWVIEMERPLELGGGQSINSMSDGVGIRARSRMNSCKMYTLVD